MWCSPSPAITLREPSSAHRLEWMWQLLPPSSKCGLAMNVTDRPRLGGDLLDGVLEHEVGVGHLQRRLERQVELVLAAPGLALGELDREPGAAQAAADRAR